MLGLLLIYFIGKRFYKLAEQYDQNKWLYAILSIVLFYGAQFVFGIIIALLDLAFDWGINWDDNLNGLNLLGIPIGLLALWGFYVLIEARWKKNIVPIKDEINDIGKS